MFKTQPKRVIYIYSEASSFIEELINEGLIDKAIKNLPATYDALVKLVAPFKKEGVILIVDDGLSQMENYLPKIFEEFTSKNNTSVIFVSQSIFLQDKDFRRISQNCHYIICMQNRRNPSKIRSLAQQIKPCNIRFILNSYADATQKKPLLTSGEGYGYFIFEFDLKSPEILSYRTNIFPDESEPITLYVENFE